MIWFKSKDNITAFFAAVIAIIAVVTSFYNTDAEVYLFPRIAAVIIVILASILLIKTFMNRSTLSAMKDSLINWRTLLPGLAVGFVYLFSLEMIGFYVSSFVAYFTICVIYGKCEMTDIKRGLFKLGTSTIFMIVLFLLFWNLLHVRTPTGLLF